MSRGKRIIAVVALVLAGATASACGAGTDPAADGKPVTVEGSATGIPSTTTSSAPAAAGKLPAAKAFKITLKTIEKTCYGSAGCNIMYRVNGVTVPAGLDPETTYEVTYKITGGEDVTEGTVVISGGKFDGTLGTIEGMASTKNKSVKLIATATSVEIL